MTILTTVVLGASPASAATAPYNQCPAVGNSPSCQILLVVNADRTVSVFGDANVGTYDGADDTLVGVQNNSNAFVDAITVTGPGSGLSGFDGDGLCTYLTLPACPFGPTGYEGPDTAFTTDASQQETVEVDFTSGGLPAGLSTYFSLEGALTAASLSARPGRLGGYVALGDSYSSGEGVGDYGYNSGLTNNACDRSPHAYGPLLDSDRSLGTLTFRACSGAVTADLFSPNHSNNIDVNTGRPEAAQLDFLAPDSKEITLTIGGNDIGFVELSQRCIFGKFLFKVVSGEPNCQQNPDLVNAVNSRLNALAGKQARRHPALSPDKTTIHSVLSVLLEAHRLAPNAQIHLAGYPRLFGNFKGECGVGTISLKDVPHLGFASVSAKVKAGAAQWFNSVVDRYLTIEKAAAVTARAAGVNVTVVDPSPSFNTHRLCDTSTSWLNPVSGFGSFKKLDSVYFFPKSFHPTVDGQKNGYEAAFLATEIGR